MSERTSYETGTPSWVDLSTPDLDGALAFYGGLFGWEFQDAGPEAGHYHSALLDGRPVAGVGRAQEGAPPTGMWTTYLAAGDADACAEAIRGAGGDVVAGPMDVFEQGRMLIARDPSGGTFGVWQAGSHHGSERVNENAAPTWNELNTRDLNAAATFYGAVFGHRFEDLPAVPSGYKLFKVGSEVVGGMLQMTDEWPADISSHWMAYIQLDDVDAGFERVRELGGTVMFEPVDSPYGRFSVIRDPQGGVLSLIKPAAPAE
jgi:predicted enzyme related to lactoylglutathione lyase